VTDYEYESLSLERGIIESLGAEFVDTFQCKTEDEVIEAARDADGLIVQYAKITRRVIDNLEKCRVIATYSIGVDKIDVQAATERGICVANVPDYCLEEVSDHTLTLLLALARKLCLANSAVKEKFWDYKVAKPIYRIKGKKLGLAGFGNIARRVAEKSAGFGMEIIAYDPFVKPEQAARWNARLVGFDELVAESDFISVHVPLSEKTQYMFNIDIFRKMKRTALVINVSRGPVIKEADLIKALQDRLIAGAALDVAEVEPIDRSNPLLAMDNVIVTPHYAWYSEESAQALQRGAAEQVAQVLQGYYPTNLVNRELLGKLQLKPDLLGQM